MNEKRTVRQLFDQLRGTFVRDYLSRVKVRRVLKYALYLFLALLVQNMLFTQLRIAGVCPMILPAAAVAVGMFEGPIWGAVLSLILGLFADMAFVENVILFTVLFPAISFATGFFSTFFINRRFFAFMGAAFLGLLVTALVQMLHIIAIDTFSAVMFRTVILQTLWSLPFAVLAYLPPARWIE